MGYDKILVLCGLFLAATAYVTSIDGLQQRSNATSCVVKKTLTTTWNWGAPDGNRRKLIYINGQFPGPALVFDEGDDVEVTVHNKLPFNITVHWHGLAMQGTPWSDGVPGLTQEPIQPDCSYIYRFKASPAGTYWYHSHTRATLLDGLYGPLYIRPKPGSPVPWSSISQTAKDIQEITKAAADPKFLLVSDWDKYTSWEYLDAEKNADLDIFCRDSVLVNGKGSVFCPGIDYLKPFVPPQLAETLSGQSINDKGCLPFVPGTEGPYLPGKPETIPKGLQTGCVASNGSVEIIEVEPKKGWISLNMVMAATFMAATVSIDSHDMWLYEVDGHFVEPRKVQGVTMYPGERYAVLIKLDQKAMDYPIRVAAALSQFMATYAVLRYKDSKHMHLLPGVIPSTPGYINYGGFPTSQNVTILDGGYTHFPPFPPNPPAAKSDAMHVLSLGRWQAPWQWTMSGKAIMPVDASSYDPVLYDPYNELAMNPNLTVRTLNGTWVDLVLRVGALPGEPREINHAIHKHASKMWFIGTGYGIWNYSSVEEAMAAEPQSFNLVNPNYRDTIMTVFNGSAWFVLRYQVTNPGAWLLHCHVEIHLAGGMGVAILDGVDKWPTIPPEYAVHQHGYPVIEHGKI